MGYTNRARTKAYDNIAVGSAYSARERTINGSLPPDTTTIPGSGENIAVGADYGAEKVVVKATTLLAIERLTP